MQSTKCCINKKIKIKVKNLSFQMYVVAHTKIHQQVALMYKQVHVSRYIRSVQQLCKTLNHLKLTKNELMSLMCNISLVWLSGRDVRLWLGDFPCPAPSLWSTGDHCVGKLSNMGQPSRPTQPSIPPGSVNE